MQVKCLEKQRQKPVRQEEDKNYHYGNIIGIKNWCKDTFLIYGCYIIYVLLCVCKTMLYVVKLVILRAGCMMRPVCPLRLPKIYVWQRGNPTIALILVSNF